MGGGKDQKQANAQLASQSKYQSGQQQAFDTRNTQDLTESKARGDSLYGDIYGGYKSLLDYKNPASMPGGGGGGGGGGAFVPPSASDPRFAQVGSMYKNFMDTGGWDPNRTASMDQNIQGFKDIGRTGGMSPEDMARARGGGVFDEFSRTGGLSDKDQANIRARGTSGIPAAFGQIRAAADRGRTIQGGYGPGASVMQGRMARAQTGSMADAALNAELGIKSQVNAGRQWGTQGMSDSELQLQSLLGRQKLAGLAGASDTERAMVESQMGGKQWGTGGLQGLAEADRQAAERAAAMSASAGAASAANDRWNMQFEADQRRAGLEGLGSLRQSVPAEYFGNKDYALKSADTYGGLQGNLSMGLKSGNKSWADYAAPIAGAVAGGMTGLGGLSSAIGAAKKIPQFAGGVPIGG